MGRDADVAVPRLTRDRGTVVDAASARHGGEHQPMQAKYLDFQTRAPVCFHFE